MKRFLLILLAMAVFVGCLAPLGLAEDDPGEALRVVYIPIDDRPYNDERMRLMAQSLGVELIMPDKSLYDTSLDGQVSEAGTCGDRGALMDWLMDNQNRGEVLILSLDQLLSGGLVNSRCMTEMTPVVLADGSTMTELEIIDYIAELAERKTVYIVDSVQRLAASFGFGGFTIRDYNVTRMYGLVQRPMLTGDQLTIENIVESYRLDTNGAPAYLSAELSEADLAYLLAPRNVVPAMGVETEAVSEDELQAVFGYLQGLAPENNGATGMNYATAATETYREVSPEPNPAPSLLTVEPETEPTANPEPTASPEPSVEPAPEISPEPNPGPGSETDPEPSSEPTPEPGGEPSPEPSAEPSPEPSPEPSEEPTPEPEQTLLDVYLSVRQRKLTLTAYALASLTPLSGVHYILGVDDSADDEQIQSNELRLFERYMDGDDQMFAALDGLGQMALAKAYQSCTDSPAVGVSVTFYGDCKNTVNAFSYKSNSENVAQVLNYFGCYETGDTGEISLLLYSGDTTEEVRNANLGKVISKLNENEADGIPTILVDVSNSSDCLMAELPLDTVHIGSLLAYSGKTESPGQVHMALNQGLARYFSLNHETPLSEKAHEAHLENLLGALVEEVYDTGPMLQNMYQFIADMGQSDPMKNVTDAQIAKINSQLGQQMQVHIQKLLDSFTESNFVTDLSPYTVSGITDANVTGVYYPWLRQFEIWGDYTCTYTAEPHDYGQIHRWCINGVSWTLFQPLDLITREQAAKMLIMFTEQDVTEGMECPFGDVAPWARDYVALAYQQEYIFGCDDGTFQGERNMTRGEFVTMLYQYAVAENITLTPSTNASFPDMGRDEFWYSEAAYALADCGVIRGFTDGTFRAQAEISRAEAVAMFTRLFDRGEELPDSLKDLQRFADVNREFWAYLEIQEASVSHYCK